MAPHPALIISKIPDYLFTLFCWIGQFFRTIIFGPKQHLRQSLKSGRQHKLPVELLEELVAWMPCVQCDRIAGACPSRIGITLPTLAYERWRKLIVSQKFKKLHPNPYKFTYMVCVTNTAFGLHKIFNVIDRARREKSNGLIEFNSS